VLGSRLKSKNLLSPGTSFSWYRNREKEFISYFSQYGDLVYCSDVFGLMEKFSIEYDVNEWRLLLIYPKEVLEQSCYTMAVNMPVFQLAILCT
jgi:hypothetical protein